MYFMSFSELGVSESVASGRNVGQKAQKGPEKNKVGRKIL
jgi:hypothetical protein